MDVDEDDMLCELSYLKKVLGSYMVRRTTRNFDFSFEPLPDNLFKKKGNEIKDVNAMMRDDEYWKKYRQEDLTESETRMGSFIDDLAKIKGFKYILFGLKALIENHVETGKNSKVDIGPINTIVTSNYIDGWRLRASAMTTANLHPNIFLKGYYAYGFKDKKSKYMGELEYSFDKKEYLPREFPKHSMTFTYQYDNMVKMATVVMEKKPKVHSKAIEEMRTELSNMLDSHRNSKSSDFLQ